MRTRAWNRRTSIGNDHFQKSDTIDIRGPLRSLGILLVSKTTDIAAAGHPIDRLRRVLGFSLKDDAFNHRGLHRSTLIDTEEKKRVTVHESKNCSTSGLLFMKLAEEGALFGASARIFDARVVRC